MLQVVFLTALFYLLSSSGKLYKPVDLITNFSPNMGNRCVSSARYTPYSCRMDSHFMLCTDFIALNSWGCNCMRDLVFLCKTSLYKAFFIFWL